MSSIRLKTKNDIRDFFRILAEESIKEAKSNFDAGADRIADQAEKDEEAYKSIREQDNIPDDLDITATAPDIEGAGEVEEVEDVEEVEAQAAPATQESDIEDVSLDSIAKKIKIMRSGISVDDTAVQEPLRTYFDLLSDAERKALYAFLNAIAAMMTGEATGENADDPSDPPYNVTMQTGEAEETEEVEEFDMEAEVEEPAAAEEEVEDVEEESGEETPIRVGGVQSKQSLAEIRRKVRNLMRS